MIPILLSGLLTALAATVAFRTWITWPTRASCPECGERTVPLADPLLRPLRGRVWRRWCSACEWEGLGRRGPDVSEGPVDHASGFRWRRAPAPRAPRFRWAEGSGDAARAAGPAGLRRDPSPDAPPSRPAHPSGFTWAAGERRDHPSGFRWAKRARSGDGPPASERGTGAAHDREWRPAHPSGFTWGSDAPAPPEPSDGDDLGFRWKESGPL